MITKEIFLKTMAILKEDGLITDFEEIKNPYFYRENTVRVITNYGYDEDLINEDDDNDEGACDIIVDYQFDKNNIYLEKDVFYDYHWV